MESAERIQHITAWIKDYAEKAKIDSLVVGISGGIDSSVVSTLCALTGIKTHVVSMPIRQIPKLHDLSMRQGNWLTNKFSNVEHHVIDLTPTYNAFEKIWETDANLLALANSKARLRMTTLYQLAQTNNGIVVGTGNKVEDFGIGFFTKYGDGGVDISPIGDCLKTEVWNMGRELEIIEDIINAEPTDGLWEDGRTDEDQIGMSYEDLERAMKAFNRRGAVDCSTEHAFNCLRKFEKIREKTLHKMVPIPVCKLGE